MTMQSFQLFNKNASTIIFLSKLFLQTEIGTRIPTFEEFSELSGVARGTVQTSLKELQKAKAIVIKSRGHLGSFLIEKDTKKLIQMADIRSLLGAMSLPYSKTYEGLATGLITSMQNIYDVPVSMAYMPDAVTRMDEMMKGRYDFIVVSRRSANKALRAKKPVISVVNLGSKSYLSANVLLFSNPKVKSIEDGMVVGLTKNDLDQNRWVKKMCKGKQVEYVKVDYAAMILALKNNKIDATVWHKDEINDPLIQMNTVPIETEEEDTSATIMVSADRPELVKLFKEIIDVKKVKEIQQKVIDEKMIPQYW